MVIILILIFLRAIRRRRRIPRASRAMSEVVWESGRISTGQRGTTNLAVTSSGFFERVKRAG